MDMMEFTAGDILQDDAQAIVNTVNCVGIMGRGIALQFKHQFPDNFKQYAAACKRSEVRPGAMFVCETGNLTGPRYIINFPTKRHWKGASRIEDIETGLDALVQVVLDKGITSLAIPPLGCGLGGLDWSRVRPLITEKLATLPDVRIKVYEPLGSPAAGQVRNKPVPAMTPGRAALVILMRRYLAGLLDPFITLLEVHKLLYFLQESGEDLRLRFKQAPYGPYAENLRHVLHVIEGHLVSGYGDGGDQPGKELSLVPGALEDAGHYLETHIPVKEHIERVADLVQGFESSFGLELLATVHWVVTRQKITPPDEVVTQVHAWNARKKQFTPRQIRLALDTLMRKRWCEGALAVSAF